MNNCSGFIRLWEPNFLTGAVCCCAGAAAGQNVAFRYANVNDHQLQVELGQRPTFQLGAACNPDEQPPDTLWVTFLWDPNGSGFAMNILPA